MLNRPATQFTIPGATLRSSPKIKWKTHINIKLLQLPEKMQKMFKNLKK